MDAANADLVDDVEAIDLRFVDVHAARAEVGHFQIGIDPAARPDIHRGAGFALDMQRHLAARREPIHSSDRDALVARVAGLRHGLRLRGGHGQRLDPVHRRRAVRIRR